MLFNVHIRINQHLHGKKPFGNAIVDWSPPCKQHLAQKSFFLVVRKWFGPDVSDLRYTWFWKGDCAESMQEMLYNYVDIIYIRIYIYIEEIQGTESTESRKIQKVLIENNACSLLFPDIKKMHFWEAHKGYPLGGLPPQIMCICTPN